MSISRKSSFDTVVVEKARDDPLQFLSNPGHFRKDLDLKGLSDSARKSSVALKPWQQAAGCFSNPSVSSTISKIVELVDECHAAIKTTLAVAQMGRPFADDVAAFCDAIAQKNEPLEWPNELLSKLITAAEKGYGRSIQAQGQLICVRHELSQISESLPLQVSKIEQDTLKRQAENIHIDPAFNGVNTCIVTLMLPAATDCEETDTWRGPVSFPSYPAYSYLTFQNVITQLNSIATDVLLFTEQTGRCAEWWNKMQGGLETLKATLHKIVPHSSILADNVTEGWETIADQFALYIHKTSPVVKDYFATPYIAGNYHSPYQYTAPLPYIAPPRRHSRRRSYSPLRISPPSSTRSSIILVGESLPHADTVVQKEQSKPLWKKLSCIS